MHSFPSTFELPYTDESGQAFGRKMDYPAPTQGNHSYDFGFLGINNSIHFNVLRDVCVYNVCICALACAKYVCM